MIKPYTFTTDDFAVMVEAGLFHDRKVELLDGVIVDMSPASPGHEFTIDKLTEQLSHAFYSRAYVRVQNAVNIELPEWLPHPDVVLMKHKDYSEKRPTPTIPSCSSRWQTRLWHWTKGRSGRFMRRSV